MCRERRCESRGRRPILAVEPLRCSASQTPGWGAAYESNSDADKQLAANDDVSGDQPGRRSEAGTWSWPDSAAQSAQGIRWVRIHAAKSSSEMEPSASPRTIDTASGSGASSSNSLTARKV